MTSSRLLFRKSLLSKKFSKTSSPRKAACEVLIKVMTSLSGTNGASTSQPAQTVQPAPKDKENKVEDEDEEEDVKMTIMKVLAGLLLSRVSLFLVSFSCCCSG